MAQADTVVLGTVPPATAGRDAVHVAVVPIVAPCWLRPGERVDRDGRPAGSPGCGPVVGIVDPYRGEDGIRPGERVWLCLTPGTITGLRHVWTHPAFKTSVPAVFVDAGPLQPIPLGDDPRTTVEG